jgi:hypothetical protein
VRSEERLDRERGATHTKEIVDTQGPGSGCMSFMEAWLHYIIILCLYAKHLRGSSSCEAMHVLC